MQNLKENSIGKRTYENSVFRHAKISRFGRKPEETLLPIREYPCNQGGIPPTTIESGEYQLRFAHSREDLDAVCRLRFEVYNLELGEGLESSFNTSRDIDEFDSQCHHLMVMHRSSGGVVGTYRIQTGAMALLRRGFYSQQEFYLEEFPSSFLDACVEVGRACISREHRNGRVLQLLWKGLARYMDWNGKRHLFGCCSLTSQDPAEGRALYQKLVKADQIHPTLYAWPRPDFVCEVGPLGNIVGEPPKIPRLFEGYLDLGALVCAEPALDRQFKTIDFLVALDIQAMPEGVFRKMLA